MRLFKIINIFVLSLILLTSCNSARRVEKGQTLYLGSKLIVKKKKTEEKFEIKNFGKKTSDAYLAVWDLPNGALFGTPFFRFIPFRLHLYNLFYSHKTNGLKYWIRENFGEEPILIEDVSPDIKIKKLIEKYNNYGHFGTTGIYTIKYKKKGKAGFINYTLDVAPAYSLRNVKFLLNEQQNKLNQLIDEYKKINILKPSMEFNLDSVIAERNKLTMYFRNNGYFYINNDDIIIEADTTIGNRLIDLQIRINDQLSPIEISKIKLDSISIEIDSIVQNKSLKYYYFDEGRLSNSFVDSIILLRKNSFYSYYKSNQTVNLLNGLGIFSNAFISYKAHPDDSTKLFPTIRLFPSNATNLSAILNGNYKATGYIGPSLNFKLIQTNVFGKAENISLEADTYYDFPIGINNNRISQSTGFSLRSTLKSPLVTKRRKFYKYGTIPFNFISANTEFNRRIEYFNLYSLNLLYGISWQSKQNIRHRIDIINATYSSIFNTTSLFDSIIKKDPFLRNSLVAQLILGSHYVFTYDKRSQTKNPIGFYYQSQIEIAGNIAKLFGSSININNENIKTLFDVPIAQFVQFNYDIRHSFKTGKIGTLAFRHIGGIGIPYGNNKRMPYMKQYFSGGTTSLRPFTARTIGPGRYIEKQRGEVNQVGDLKFEVNLEYRFKLGVRFNGALWGDAGNIWLFNEDASRPGSGIRWNKIAEDSYLTSGIGLRLDLNYLLIRYDIGAVIYSPAYIKNERWIWQRPNLIVGSVIGIGYPF